MEEYSIASLQELKKTRSMTAEESALLTLSEMLTSRGLKSEKFEPVSSSLDETKIYNFAGILIIFSNKTRVSEKELNNFISFASENNFNAGTIIVSPSELSSSVMKVLIDHITDNNVPLIQIFEIRKLGFNYSKHRMVPRHRLCSDSEKPAVMKRWNLKTLEQLEKIWCQDPMAKFIGARPGDLVEVIGMCETSAENLHYRYCIPEV